MLFAAGGRRSDPTFTTVLIGDGTAGSPSLAFSSDNDGSGTGFYRSAANAIGVSTNGVLRWSWDANGHLAGASGRTLTVAGAFTASSAASNAIGNTGSSTTNLILAAGVVGVSPLRIPHGDAPTSPVNGDMWTTTAGLFVRINGATVGPLAA